MRILAFLSVIFLSACSISNQVSVPPLENQSGSILSGSINNSGEVQEPLVETLSGEVNEYYPVFDGLETKVVQAYHTSGIPTKVSFINSEANSMLIALDFLDDQNPNLRLSRIIMPDGTMDGPFGVKTGYNLSQKGGYVLVFSENQMAGDSWSGVVDISVSLSGGTYPDTAVLF